MLRKIKLTVNRAVVCSLIWSVSGLAQVSNVQDWAEAVRQKYLNEQIIVVSAPPSTWKTAIKQDDGQYAPIYSGGLLTRAYTGEEAKIIAVQFHPGTGTNGIGEMFDVVAQFKDGVVGITTGSSQGDPRYSSASIDRGFRLKRDVEKRALEKTEREEEKEHLNAEEQARNAEISKKIRANRAWQVIVCRRDISHCLRTG